MEKNYLGNLFIILSRDQLKLTLHDNQHRLKSFISLITFTLIYYSLFYKSMLSDCLKLFVILSLVANFTESKLENAKECFEDGDCSLGFSCMQAKKYRKRICAKDKIISCRISLFYPNRSNISQKVRVLKKKFLNFFPPSTTVLIGTVAKI